MVQFLTACPKILGLLDGFYRMLPEHPPLDAVVVVPSEMPEQQRRLLVHNTDMTSTLTGHHREKILLRVLQRTMTNGKLSRHIVLESAVSGKSVEYGASSISLDVLDKDVRGEVVEGSKPLGGILNHHGVVYSNCPGAFFRVRSNDLMNKLFGLDESNWLYGRCNCLTDDIGRTIAEVVEILPPHGKQVPSASRPRLPDGT